ncbi:ABC transporter ATP-binding protein [Candidatus Saccharibacteria bacterium]|nr:MAG: ABC transporter ATP-binding protein [Candidatus Saccharibacteria bacterium]
MKDILRILKSGRELKWHYFAISLLTTVLSLVTIMTPLLSGWAIDEIRKGTGANVRYAALLAVGIFALDLMQTVVSNINGYIGDRVLAKLTAILSRDYYSHLLTLPQSYFDRELSGKIINRLNRSISQITQFIHMMSNNFLQFIFSTVLSLGVVAYYSWQVALMLFALYPIFIWMTVRTSARWQVFQKQKNEHNDIASGRFGESINQVKVVKSFVQEARELKFFNRHYRSMVDISKPQSALWHKQDVIRRLILNIIFFAVYLFIFVKGAQGVFTPGQAVALILYAMNIRIPIFSISYLVENTQRAVADSRDYFEIMEIKPDIKDELAAEDLVVKSARVEFRDVVFGYGDQDVLKNISLLIEPGTKVALVGESGEGKTTLTNLLLRLYEARDGEIFIDSQNIRKVTQSSLRGNIGVVFQDPALFSGTIAENISYANPKATDRQILAAAKAANADEFVSKLKKGYDTEIGERGLKLSGGQKQRIAIARALLKDAPILILDEATSSLDSKSEIMVQEALERLMQGRTTIIIAHRLSTIAHVDQIVTLKNGQINEVGSPAKLAKSGGIYANLLKLQHGKDKESTKLKLSQYDINA